MVFKAVSGVSAKKVWPTYNSQSASAEFVMEALDVTNNHQDHYKNRIVMNWDNFYPSQVNKIHCYHRLGAGQQNMPSLIV